MEQQIHLDLCSESSAPLTSICLRSRQRGQDGMKLGGQITGGMEIFLILAVFWNFGIFGIH